MIQGMECLPHEVRLRELGLFSLDKKKKKRLQRDLIAAFQFLRSDYKKWTDSSAMSVVTGQGEMVLNLKRRNTGQV